MNRARDFKIPSNVEGQVLHSFYIIMATKTYSEKLLAGRNRTYFFDVYETQGGNRYVRISEIRVEGEKGRQRSDIVVFSDRLDEFIKALRNVGEQMR